MIKVFVVDPGYTSDDLLNTIKTVYKRDYGVEIQSTSIEDAHWSSIRSPFKAFRVDVVTVLNVEDVDIYTSKLLEHYTKSLPVSVAQLCSEEQVVYFMIIIAPALMNFSILRTRIQKAVDEAMPSNYAIEIFEERAMAKTMEIAKVSVHDAIVTKPSEIPDMPSEPISVRPTPVNHAVVIPYTKERHDLTLGSVQSSGYDIKADLELTIKDKILGDRFEVFGKDDLIKYISIYPGGRVLIKTGIKLQLPVEIEAQVRSRSGLAIKNGVFCLNSPGTIDSDYRGDVGVILCNHSFEDYIVKDGDRIAQLIFAAKTPVFLVVAEEVNNTDRGDGGFGHTGNQ